MTNKIFMQKEFAEFLPKNGVNSIDSYINYVNNADKQFRHKLFELVENIYKAKSLDALDELREIGEELFEIIEVTSKNHYRAGFMKYLDFIEEKICLSDEVSVATISLNDIKKDVEEEEKIYNTNSAYIHYSSTFVRDTLFRRLISQDRYNNNGHLIFPIRFIKQYFYKTGHEKTFDKILNHQIDNIIYFVGTTAKKVKDLKDLEIEYSNGQVFINKEKVSTKTEVDNLATLIVKSGKLREIVIDHIEPISLLLESLDKNEFPQLLLITDEFRKRVKGGNLDRDSVRLLSTRIADDESFRNRIHFDKLEEEFQKINAKMNLQLMHSSYNSKKGAK